MPLKKTIEDRRNTGVKMTYFNVDQIEINNNSEGTNVVIRLGGYLNEAQCVNGKQPIDRKTVIVPLEEPEDGDEFTSLRSAINTKVTAFIASAQKLVLKTAAWEDAEEK